MSTQTKRTKTIIAAIAAVIITGITVAYLAPAQSTVEILPTTSEDQERNDALGVAQRYVVTSPTFAFDGDINSLKTEYVGSTKSIPPQHIFKATFESSHAGYGNREGQMVAQVITPHTMDILVAEGKIISAVTDETWDEQKELFIQREADPDLSMDMPEAYDYASFVDSLEKRNVSVSVVETLEDSMFSVPGIVLSVNGEITQVYEFESGSAAEMASAMVSEDGTQIGLNSIRWMDTPHFFSQDKIIVQYIGHDTETLSLLESILGSQFAGM